MANCLLSGLPDVPLVDAEPWSYVLTLGDPEQGPFDLTGSDLAITFRTDIGWVSVSNLSTLPAWPGMDGTMDGTITIQDAQNGVVAITSDPYLRAYRVPVLRSALRLLVVHVTGDLLRLAQSNPASRPEYLGSISFPVRASTTQWRPPATS